MNVASTPATKAWLTSPAKRWTQSEFHTLPEGPPYYELEEGELIEMVRPRGRHQQIILRIGGALDDYVIRNRLGRVWPEVEVDITSTQTYVPDLSFLTNDHLDKFVDDLRIVGAPDLVVEILSPATAARDETKKLKTYQQAGVPWYWIINPDVLTVLEYKHTPDGYLLSQVVETGDEFAPGVFPGLIFNLAKLMDEVIGE